MDKSQFKQKLRRVTNILSRKELIVRKPLQLPKKGFGKTKQGWNLVCSEISTDSIIYSVGIGYDLSFDLDVIRDFGVRIHAFDPTPLSLKWLDSQLIPDELVVHRYGIGDRDGEVSFRENAEEGNVNFSISFDKAGVRKELKLPIKRIRTAMNELGHSRIDILKLNIEGGEYGLVDDMLKSNIFPKQLLIEYHHNKFDCFKISDTKRSINALKNAGYGIFSVKHSVQVYCFVLI